MPVESLTYAQIGDRLGTTPEAARALVKRLRLPRQKGNDGKALVLVDLVEIDHKALPARSPRGHQSDVQAITAPLTARIAELEQMLAAAELSSAGHREDFERERARVDHLLSEFLTATGDLMRAKETAARLDGELCALRPVIGSVQAVPQRVGWWRRLVD